MRYPVRILWGASAGEDVTAGENVPPFRRSTVDGYAVIAGETYGAGDANPIFFRVSGPCGY